MPVVLTNIPDRRIPLLLLLCLFFFPSVAWAQGGRRPRIIEPKIRTEPPPRPTKTATSTRGVLIVLFNYEVAGKVSIETLAGKPVVEETSTDEKGQAQFLLKRRQSYKVKGSAPGFIADERKSNILKATDTVLLKLIGKSVTVNLIDLPQSAQIFIDGQLQPNVAIDQAGSATIELPPGRHKLLVKHPEYRDFPADLPDLKAGTSIIVPVTLDKLAKLTFQTLPNATVLIDGDVQAKVEANGKVSFDYVVNQTSEHSIRVELLGYQPWTERIRLAPGARTINVKLEPIVTSVGVSDFFDNLSQWSSPSTWKIVSDPKNNRLEVRGDGLGLLKDKLYRDFQANFLLWLDNGKGATWALRADKEGKNYYLFHLSGPKSTAYLPRRFYIFLVSDGQAPVLVNTPIPVITELNNKSSYTINITVRENKITHTIVSNDTGATDELGSWTDTSIEKDKFLYGTFGFRTLADEVFSVDELALSVD